MNERIVYQGTSKKGRPFTIRYPGLSDAKNLCDYANVLSQERTFLRLQGEHIMLDAEEKWLSGILEKIEQHKSIMFVVYSNETLIGNATLFMEDAINSHVGAIGITLAKDVRGEGIGTVLMDTILKEAQKQLPQLELVRLTLYATNTIALNMYKKYGFVEYGKLPRGIKRGSEYTDYLYMYKRLK